MRTLFGVAIGFSVVLQRYFLLGVLFCAIGFVMVAGALGLLGFQLDADAGFVLGRVFLIILGGCFACIGCAILFGGLWWLRRATWLLCHTAPVAMVLNGHTRLLHEGDWPGPGDVLRTAFVRLMPVDTGAGIRQFKRVPLEWPTWRLRWQGRHGETVLVFYDYVQGGPLVIQAEDGQLFVSQMWWDRTRRRRSNPPD